MKHESAQFAKLLFFLLGEDNKEQIVYTSIKYKFSLVESLKVNILIGNNIIAPKDFIFNINLGHAVIRNYSVKITIKARQKS